MAEVIEVSRGWLVLACVAGGLGAGLFWFVLVGGVLARLAERRHREVLPR